MSTGGIPAGIILKLETAEAVLYSQLMQRAGEILVGEKRFQHDHREAKDHPRGDEVCRL